MWKDEVAVQFAPNMSLPGGFKLGRTGQDYCDVRTATGEYSCLQVDLVFARELSYFLVTMYVPCIMIVVVSWFAFWIDHKSAPARVTLGVSTLLALSTTLASIQKSLPPVAYMKVLCLPSLTPLPLLRTVPLIQVFIGEVSTPRSVVPVH